MAIGCLTCSLDLPSLGCKGGARGSSDVLLVLPFPWNAGGALGFLSLVFNGKK